MRFLPFPHPVLTLLLAGRSGTETLCTHDSGARFDVDEPKNQRKDPKHPLRFKCTDRGGCVLCPVTLPASALASCRHDATVAARPAEVTPDTSNAEVFRRVSAISFGRKTEIAFYQNENDFLKIFSMGSHSGSWKEGPSYLGRGVFNAADTQAPPPRDQPDPRSRTPVLEQVPGQSWRPNFLP